MNETLQSIHTLYQQQNMGDSWLKPYQQQALETLTKQGLPNKSHEHWKYSAAKLGKALDYSVQAVSVANDSLKLDQQQIPYLEGAYNLVWVDGKLDTDYSDSLPAGVFTPFEQITDSAIAEKILASGQDAQDSFQTINLALLQQGFLLHLKQDQSLDRPIHCIYINGAGQGEQACHFYKLAYLEQGASLSFIEISLSYDHEKAYMHNTVFNSIIEENACLKHYRYQNENHHAQHVSTVKHQIAKHAHVEDFFLSVGGALTRNECHVDFSDTHASADFKGINLSTGKQHMDNYLPFTHHHPDCRSSQLYHSVIADSSRSSFYGKMIVPKYAVRTDSEQLHKALLLSDKAMTDSRPELEVYNDDVQCHHGSAIGQLDQQALYYLMARGIDQKQARAILVEAFIETVLDDLNDEFKNLVGNRMQHVIHDWAIKHLI